MSEQLDVTFRDQSLTDLILGEGLRFKVLDLEGDGMRGFDVRTQLRPGAPGTRITDVQPLHRTIRVTYSLNTLMGISHDALTRKGEVERLIMGALNGPEMLGRLELSHLSGYFMAAVRDVYTTVRRADYQQGVIEFYCPQPYLYGSERTVTPSGGTLSIDSNTYVEPVILWETSSAVGAAWIEVDGQRLTVDTGISSGQQINIDCARKETRVGGVLNVENIHGVYPRVYDGSTVTTSPGGSLEMTYQERWI